MLTSNMPPPGGNQGRRARYPKPLLLAATVALVGVGLASGLYLTLGRAPASSNGSTTASTYSYYLSAIGAVRPGWMMGGSGYQWMMGRSGYRWMVGGTDAPGWMVGGTLPGFMMTGSTDPSTVVGKLFADAPGPRVSPEVASRLGDQTPGGATVDRVANRLTFDVTNVSLTVLASPSMPAESFKTAGMVNPTVVVPVGAHVNIRLVNADGDMAHGLVIGPEGATASATPMMGLAPKFRGAALWFLGDPTKAGMHVGVLSFTASTAGTYQYFCPLPGHAQEGMAGTFVVLPGS